MGKYIHQFLIAVDQLINSMTGGCADETFSARAYRRSQRTRFWRVFRVVIDWIFFWQADHCYQSWLSEFDRKHLPSVYSLVSPAEARDRDIHNLIT